MSLFSNFAKVALLLLLWSELCMTIWSELDAQKLDTDHCTSIIVGPKASLGGSMTTHTSDCSNCDFRLSKIPSRDWPEGSLRPLYLLKYNYPATISTVRGDAWLPNDLDGSLEQLKAWGNESTITGFIPQVPHTYALFEGRYGIINEHQVAIGESTCPSKLWAAPITAGGKARIEVKEMSVIALERSTSAREAIQIMGELSTTYGFYSSEWVGGDVSLGEGGEALTVIDKKEAWMFHVLPDDSGASAVWVAQRVPDDHVSVVANQFVIRKVDPASEDFMYSSNLWTVAERMGFWKPSDGLLDFTKTYAGIRLHPTYSTRRVWRVFNLVAPNLNLSPYTDALANDYPFSVKPETLLTPQDLMRIQRDHYEGTEFDLTKGIAAGPYGDPNRFDTAPVDRIPFNQVIKGAYERSISLFRTSYSFVAQARANVPDDLALMWFAPHAPSGSSYAPFYVKSASVPLPYRKGSLFKYDEKVAFWNFCAVANYAARFYRHAMIDVRFVQSELMDQSLEVTKKVEKLVMSWIESNVVEFEDDIVNLLTATVHDQADNVVSRWRQLFHEIITRYHDGYSAENLDTADIYMRKLFYPKYWLEVSGFWNSKPNNDPDALLFESNNGMISDGQCNGRIFQIIFWTVVISSFATCGLIWLYQYCSRNSKGYVNIGPGIYMPVDEL